MVYDKTIFKPEELDTLGRYKFSLVDAGEDSEKSDASSDVSLSSTEGSDTSSSEATEAPSQFDLGDFSNMKPAEESTDDGQEDELPLLGGPEADQ